MASETFTHAVAVRRSPEEVYSALQDPDTWRGIAGITEVTDASHDHMGRLTGYRFTAAIGGRDHWGDATVVRSEAPEAMTVDIANSEVSGSIAMAMAPDPAGTLLAVTVIVRPTGLMARLAFPLIVAAIGNGMAGNVEDFAESLTARLS